MATGDTNDIIGRLKALLPKWFGDNPRVVTAILTGWASVHSFVYAQIAYAKLQTRIKTATDGWLDMIAADYFGSTLRRKQGQSDVSFLAAIMINLFRERGTRRAIVKVLQDLTGRTPWIFEPARPADTGAYATNTMGYGAAGGYGSLLLPYQAFVIAYRQAGTGIPSVGGYGLATYGATQGGPGGYGVGQIEYAGIGMTQGAVADSDIYAAIDSVKPAATIIWTRISN